MKRAIDFMTDGPLTACNHRHSFRISRQIDRAGAGSPVDCTGRDPLDRAGAQPVLSET